MNRTCEWCVSHMPPPNHECRYFPYAYVFNEAYGYVDKKKAGKQIRKDLEEFTYELFMFHGCAIQLGAHSNGTRGLRLMNVRNR